LVINGHNHDYQRFTRINANGNLVRNGLREIVAGLYKFGTILSTSQVRNSSTYGVLKVTLEAASYSWKFIPVAGQTFTDGGITPCR
jgi:hypothetical protein